MQAKLFFRAFALGFFILSVGSFTSYAQFNATPASFEGFWAGSVTDVTDSENSTFLILRIEDGKASQFFYDSDANDFVKSDFDRESTVSLGNNFHYTWLNQGEIWSETHAHALSFLNPELLWCVMVRQVTNASEDEDVSGINDEWNVVYEGGLDFFRSLTALREAYLD